ncbi:major facilitator superfamily domain-containing protein [Catenaria anguillulae PL171]|uniref:Major facilitator superfamily domain-containing protein n=1 Tax=Catenaria anguillulae PL171 TaxID=765915 RepID=A0A1Y2HMA9_9FUNG|nr:major facilitator superfamily domain-containing protein [Catenaria anguillulae PL171]
MSAVPQFQAMDRQKFSRFHLKTIVVSGIGFFTDALDIFIINLAIPMIAYTWWFHEGAKDMKHASAMPSIVTSLLKASTQVGTLCGQLVFGYLGDKLGRKATYGVVLAIMIVATINTSLAADTKGAIGVGGMLIFWRLILGIGIGGDYPISAVIASEFASVSTRGLMVAAVFSMQGLGILVGSLCAVIVLAILKPTLGLDPLAAPGFALYQPLFDNVWRLLLFLGVIPAIAAVYWRLQVPETPRFTAAKGDLEMAQKDMAKVVSEAERNNSEPSTDDEVTDVPSTRNSLEEAGAADLLTDQYPGYLQEAYSHITFTQLFSHWRNFKVLFACSAAWFLLDVGFYGVQLNASDILKFLGYGVGDTPFDFFWSISVGNLLLSLCGTVPGYWFTVFTIERLGRIKIQLMGFTVLSIIFVVLTIWFHQLKGTTLFFVLFTAANFFFNFGIYFSDFPCFLFHPRALLTIRSLWFTGPNTTTFILPAEIFPTRFRSTCHGIAAATGKLGAIIAAFGFDQIKGKDGENMQVVLGIFTACMLGGLLVTFWVPETKGKTLEELGDAFYSEEVVANYPIPAKGQGKGGKKA